MKINWIFDLDYTLYQLHPQARQFDYNYLQYDPELKKKIQLLPGRKLLFTNANVWHTLKCVKMMRIEKTFHKVCCIFLLILHLLIYSSNSNYIKFCSFFN